MVSKIVVLSDGTGNSSTKGEKTNVWRIFQALKPSVEQVAYYDDGVGTSTNKYLAILGGVFGWGLKRNVIDIYKFICRHYPGADGAKPAISERPTIFGFGFSRGSFTIRMLVGMIQREGLVTFKSEEELHRNAKAAFSRYRAEAFPVTRMAGPGKWLVLLWRALFVNSQRAQKKYQPVADAIQSSGRKDGVRIKFLGLFDTVDAYGMPIAELKDGIDKWIWPMAFVTLDLPEIVDQACHALALDDERATFQPYQWDEVYESGLVNDKKFPPGRLKQVWFAGMHSNVGGGYPEDQLSYVPLEWIMHEAMAKDLEIDIDVVAAIERAKSPLARMYDSRSGAGAYWRYDPRGTNNYAPQGDGEADERARGDKRFTAQKDNPFIKHDVTGMPIYPVIHHSVLTRMVFDDGYASATLPGSYWVMGPTGKLTAAGHNAGSMHPDLCKNGHDFGATRNGKDPTLTSRETIEFNKAYDSVTPPRDDARKLVWDTIWWRRVLTLATAFLTAIVVIFPFASHWVVALVLLIPHWIDKTLNLGDVGVEHDWAYWTQNFDVTGRGLINPLVSNIGSLFPTYLKPWVEAVTAHSFELGIAGVLIYLCFRACGLLQTRVRDRARLCWNQHLVPQYLDATEASDIVSCRRLRNWVLGLAAYTLFLLYIKFAWNLPWVGVIEGVYLTVAVLLIWIYRVNAHGRLVTEINTLREELKKPQPQKLLPSNLHLRFARRIRTNGVLSAIYRYISNTFFPGLFALASVAVVFFAVNQIAFVATNSVGMYCAASPIFSDEQKLDITSDFNTKDPCWRSGAYLKAGRQYEVTLTIKEDWRDDTRRTDVAGFAIDSLPFALGAPMRRWMTESWFQPIARINAKGNDEHVLSSIRPFERHEYPPQCAPDPRLKSGDRAIDPVTGEIYACTDKTPPDRKKLTARITPRISGDLFIFVNDAAIAFWPHRFYSNNMGSATVTVKAIENEPLYPTSRP